MTFCEWVNYWFGISCLDAAFYITMFWGGALAVSIFYEILKEFLDEA